MSIPETHYIGDTLCWRHACGWRIGEMEKGRNGDGEKGGNGEDAYSVVRKA